MEVGARPGDTETQEDKDPKHGRPHDGQRLQPLKPYPGLRCPLVHLQETAQPLSWAPGVILTLRNTHFYSHTFLFLKLLP